MPLLELKLEVSGLSRFAYGCWTGEDGLDWELWEFELSKLLWETPPNFYLSKMFWKLIFVKWSSTEYFLKLSDTRLLLWVLKPPDGPNCEWKIFEPVLLRLSKKKGEIFRLFACWGVFSLAILCLYPKCSKLLFLF